MQYCFQNYIVDQLFSRDGLLFTYEEFVSPGDYAKVFGVIPSGVCMLFKSQPWVYVHEMSLLFPTDTPIGKICFSNYSGNNNRSIRSLFQRDTATISIDQFKRGTDVNCSFCYECPETVDHLFYFSI